MSRLYYYALRVEARRRTMNSLNKRIIRSGGIATWDKLTLSSILGEEPGDALAFAREKWPQFYDPEKFSGFTKSWESIAYTNANDPDQFDLAIWQEVEEKQVLVALAQGNPSHARTYLTLKWVERYLGPNPLAGRALWPILVCAEEYARLLGSRYVLIKDPLYPSVYEQYGYTVFSHPGVAFGGKYVAKELEYE